MTLNISHVAVRVEIIFTKIQLGQSIPEKMNLWTWRGHVPLQRPLVTPLRVFTLRIKAQLPSAILVYDIGLCFAEYRNVECPCKQNAEIPVENLIPH